MPEYVSVCVAAVVAGTCCMAKDNFRNCIHLHSICLNIKRLHNSDLLLLLVVFLFSCGAKLQVLKRSLWFIPCHKYSRIYVENMYVQLSVKADCQKTFICIYVCMSEWALLQAAAPMLQHLQCETCARTCNPSAAPSFSMSS